MEKFLLASVFVALTASAASAGEITCDVTTAEDKYKPIAQYTFHTCCDVATVEEYTPLPIILEVEEQFSASATPTELTIGNAKVKIWIEDGKTICRLKMIRE